MNWRRTVTLATVIAGVTSIAQAQLNLESLFPSPGGFVYTETNAANNSILVFSRAADGTLTQTANVATGGLGGGVVSVGSQGALAISQDGRWLFAVNEGNSTISVLERTPAGLKAVQTISSNGTLPVSLTVSRNLVYVLNDGGTVNNVVKPANISGFFFDDFRGTLTPLPNSTRSLSASSPTVPAAGPDAAEIKFDNTGSFLYVTEVGTSLIDKYSIGFFGTPSEDQTQNSFGSSPFAFAFDPKDNLLVTEVRESTQPSFGGAGAVTSYQLNREGTLNTISGSVPDAQTAPCWLAISTDGRFAYAVNTASSVISGYEVGFNGELSLLGNGVTAHTSAAPLDLAFTRDSRYLYNVSGSGTLVGYQVQANGSLTPIQQTLTVPATSRGLIAQ